MTTNSTPISPGEKIPKSAAKATASKKWIETIQ